MGAGAPMVETASESMMKGAIEGSGTESPISATRQWARGFALGKPISRSTSWFWRALLGGACSLLEY